MKQKKSAFSNARIAVIFFVFLALIIGISLIFKVALVVKAGQFNDSRRFTFSASDNRSGEVISLSSSTKSITIFKLGKNIKSADAGKFLEIPIDGHISSNSLNLNQEIGSLFLRSLLNYKSLQTNLTVIDFFKLFLLAKSIPNSAIRVIDIQSDLSGADIDKIVGRLVSDELIKKDGRTIQIINGTDVAGLGNRLARLITNMGGNVMIVATSDTPKKNSAIYYNDKKTYTIERLNKVLGYTTINSSEFPIFDITVVIGGDKLSSNPF